MYDRSHRFPKLSTSTPDRVGPGTYNTARTIGKDGSKCAPFLSSQPRNTFLGSKACLYQPGPTSYNPCTEKQPKGFISMDKGAPRFIHIQDVLPPVEDLEKEEVDNISEKLLAKPSYTGKMLSGVMLNEQNTPVPSIPRKRGEKQFIFTYDENTEIYSLQSLLQTTNENQKGQVFHDSLKFKRYKGVYFGNRTEPRDDSLLRRSEGPGPTDYDVLSKTWEVPVSYTGKKWLAIHHTKDGKDYITLVLKPEKLPDTVNPVKEISFFKGYHPVHLKSVPMRYFDLLMRNATTEDIPAPNYYNTIKDFPSSANKSKAREEKYMESIFSDNIQRKLSFRRLNVQHRSPKLGFNSSSLRFITKTPETPGPGKYEISLSKYRLNVGEDPNSAFLHRAPRFQDYNDDTPGFVDQKA